jgi:hypothetical protein
MFLTLQTWHEPEAIFALAGIAAFGRTEEDTEELFSVQREYLYRTYPDARIFTLTIPGVVDISSTELREQLSADRGANLLAPAVYGYILKEGLYGTGADLKHLPLSKLRPVALSYLKHKRIPHVLGTEQEAIRLAERYGATWRRPGVGPCSTTAPRSWTWRHSWPCAGTTASNWTNWSKRRRSCSTPRPALQSPGRIRCGRGDLQMPFCGIQQAMPT